MADDLKAGDNVKWQSHGSTAEGKVVKKLTRETDVKGHTAKATSEEPQYLVKSDRSGAEAAHKPEALTKDS